MKSPEKTTKAARIKKDRYALSAPPVITPQQASDAVIQGDKTLCTADKEAIAAFYLKLARSQPPTANEFNAALRRLRMRIGYFVLAFPLARYHPKLPDGPIDFLIAYMKTGWFPQNRAMLEELSIGLLLGKLDMEFRAYLKAWWIKECKIAEAEGVAYRKDSDGNVIPDFTGPDTEEEKADDRRKVKNGLLARSCQRLKDKRNKESKTLLRIIEQELRRRAECMRTLEGKEELERWTAEQLEHIVHSKPGLTKTYTWKK